MKVAFYPDSRLHNSQGNIYIQNIEKILSSIADVVPLENIVKNPLLLFSTDYLYLNWFENLFFNHNNVFISRVECLFKILLLRICKLFGSKVIVVFHNKIPHSITIDSKIYKTVFKTFFKKYLNLSDTIIVLNKYSIKYLIDNYGCDASKIKYIPHGNYIGMYKDYECDDRNNKINVGYVGRINKYKHVKEIVSAYNSLNLNNLKLVIEGGISDLVYQQQILDINKDNDNNHIVFNDISDELLIKKLKQLDVMIVPYHPDEALNSGLIYLAMSYNIVVATTMIGCVRDLPEDLYFKIDCDDVSNDSKLEIAIKKCLDDINKNHYRINEIKENAYNYVKNNHSWDISEIELRNILGG